MNRERPLHLVWRRTMLDGVLETQFLRNVALAGLARPQRWIAVEDGQPLPDGDDLLVCSFGDCGDYLRELRANGRRNIGVLHLGDENAGDDIGFYAEADYVLRHYHHPGLTRGLLTPAGHCRAVLWIPNGWARGVGPAEAALLPGFECRRHEVFFAGYAGPDGRRLPDRQAMLDALGKTAETIRFYDALEMGALPVVTDGAWLRDADGIAALGPPPVVVLNHWRELPACLDAAYGESHRSKAAEWWQNFKELTQARVADVVEAAFARNGDGT
jgi:hypothetical protein